MKSLRFQRLSALNQNHFVKVIYGANHKFSGYVSGNDGKKSLEITNSKGEILVASYSDIKSFIIKKCSDNLLPVKTTEEIKPEIPVQVLTPENILPESQENIVLSEESSIEDKKDNNDKEDNKEDENKLIPPEFAAFFENQEYIEVPQINHDYITNLYGCIDDKEIKNIVNPYFNSFMAGDKVHDMEKCIKAAEGLDRIFPDYGDRDKAAVRLLANMYAYTGNFSAAYRVFTQIDDLFNIAVYSWLAGDYEISSINSYMFIRNCFQNNQGCSDNMRYILVNSTLKTDNSYCFYNLIKNYHQFDFQDSIKAEECINYLLFSKGLPFSESKSAKLEKLVKCYKFEKYQKNADTNDFPKNVIFGHVFSVERMLCTVQSFSNPSKRYTFDRSTISIRELSEKLSDSEQDFTKINVSFTSSDGKKAINVMENNLSAESMINLGKKYFQKKEYKSAIDCFCFAFSENEHKEDMLFRIVSCYNSLAESENEPQNFRLAKKFLDKNGLFVSDKYRLNEEYFNIYRNLNDSANSAKYLDSLIESSENPDKKLGYLMTKAETLFSEEKYPETAEVLNKWLEYHSSIGFSVSDSVYIDKFNSINEKCRKIIEAEKAREQEKSEAEKAEINEEKPEIITETPEIPENQNIIAEKVNKSAVKESKKAKKAAECSQQPDFQILSMEAAGIISEIPLEIEYTVKPHAERQKCPVKDFSSELKKILKKNKKDAYMICIIITAMSNSEFFSLENFKNLIWTEFASRNDKNYESIDFIIEFLYSYGLIEKISADGREYFFVTKSGFDFLGKDIIKKILGMRNSCKLGLNAFDPKNTADSVVRINHQNIIYDMITSFYKKYFMDCIYRSTEYIKSEIVFIRKNKPVLGKGKADCAFMLVTPVIPANPDNEVYKSSVKMFAEIVKTRAEMNIKNPENLALIIISDSCGLQWRNVLSEIPEDFIRTDKFYILCENNLYIDRNGNKVSSEDIISLLLEENPPENPPENSPENTPGNTQDNDNINNNIDIINTDETEQYLNFMKNSDDVDFSEDKISPEVCDMIKAKKYYCALTYLKAVSELDENYAPVYNLFSMALDNPAEKCNYTSSEIFSIPKYGTFIDCGLYESCILSAKLRAIFYNSGEYDYSISSFANEINEISIVEKYPEIKTLADIFADFRKEFNTGMDCFADYCMRDKLGFEEKMSGIRHNADELYHRYLNSTESFQNLRVKIYKGVMFSDSSEIMQMLKSASQDEYEKVEKIESFLIKNFVRDKCVISPDNISEEKVDRYIEKIWDKSDDIMKSQGKTTNASSELIGGARTHSNVALKKISSLICEWVNTVKKQTEILPNESAMKKYQEKREDILGILSEIIADTDSADSAGESIVNRTARDIFERIDGSYDVNMRKYYFIDFLKNNLVLLDENGLPDLSSSFCQLGDFGITERISRHFREPEKTFEERLNEIFSRDIKYNDYGSAVIINKYLVCKLGITGNANAGIDKLEDFKKSSAQKASRIHKEFIEDIQLAECLGQLYGNDEIKKLLEKISDIWYVKYCASHNYGFYAQLVESLMEFVRRKAKSLETDFRERLEIIKSKENISESNLEKINTSLENLNYTVAEDYIKFALQGENISSIYDNSSEINYLDDFWKQYPENYRKCIDGFVSGKNSDSEIILNWISEKGSGGAKNIEKLLEKLGWKNCKVSLKGKKTAVSEKFFVTLEKSQDKKENYPIDIFGSLAEENGFDVLCLFGDVNADLLLPEFKKTGNSADTLVLLDYALTESERRHIAREIKSDTSINKVFAVVDRVSAAYLSLNYSESRINNMLMSITLPFSNYQPYDINLIKKSETRIFDFNEAFKTVTVPLGYAGIYFKNPGTVSLILANSNYISDIVCYFCYTLVDVLRRKDYAGYKEINSPPYIVSDKHIKTVISNEDFRRNMNEMFMNLLSGDYYTVALVIAYLNYHSNSVYGYTAEEIRQAAEKNCIKKIEDMSDEELSEILEKMCHNGILSEAVKNYYDFQHKNFCSLFGTASEIEDKFLKNYIGD